MTDTAHNTHTGRKRAGGLLSTLSLLLSLVLVVALVIFVVQNSNTTTIDFLGWNLDLSQGIALLGAAAVGAVIAFFVSGALRVRRAVR